MDKTKKIIMACVVAIITTLLISYINNNYLTDEKYEAYALNKLVIAGENIDQSMLDKVQVSVKDRYISKDQIYIYTEQSVAKENLNIGQILTKDLVEKENEEKNEKTEYMSIPIANPENAMAYQIKRGDKVNLYYTSKLSQTNEITKNFEKEYSSKDIDGMITIRILENVPVINTYNEIGEIAEYGSAFKQVVFKTDQKTAMIISNLKGQGVFDICLVN